MAEFVLKACPFCCGKPKLMYYDPIGGVRCTQCGIMGRCFRDVSTPGDCMPKVAQAWNKRVACDASTFLVCVEIPQDG
nr:MAG TPA: restriction alleviation protein [Caudoviricetes sp.]